jgi:hypothetical protein
MGAYLGRDLILLTPAICPSYKQWVCPHRLWTIINKRQQPHLVLQNCPYHSMDCRKWDNWAGGGHRKEVVTQTRETRYSLLAPKGANVILTLGICSHSLTENSPCLTSLLSLLQDLLKVRKPSDRFTEEPASFLPLGGSGPRSVT